jgi:N-methylhydantoinase A
VGPRSAGAEPGPACYGKGGTEPAVTDANLLLGYLDPDAGLAGGIELDREAAASVVGGLADDLGLDVHETAAGIHEVANQEMVRALRVITVERGIDPRGFDLLAFGGAGPLHAASIAAELGIGRVLCPRAGGVLSALGLVCAERRRDTTLTVMLAGARLTPGGIAAAVGAARESLGPEPDAELEAIYELRYRGQSFELPIPGPLDPDPAELLEAFAVEHERRYGYREESGAVELVNIRLAARDPLPGFEPPAAEAGEPVRSRRTARFGDAELEIEVIAGQPAPGTRTEGPCVFDLPETTFLVPPGWKAEVDRIGTISASRGGADR